MRNFVCKYAIAQFLPYPETGEFANVGVVIACPEINFLGAKMAVPKRTKRITDFFEGLEARVYREAIRYVEADLNRFAAAVNKAQLNAAFVFDEITRPRETMIRFGEQRPILTNGHPSQELEALFKRFVERDFVTREYEEERLTTLVGGILRSAALQNHFRADHVGNDFRVKFPFVHLDNGKPTLAIKPLHLAHKEPSKVLDHGSHWVARVERLRRHGGLPNQVLFPVNEAKSGRAAKAATEIIRDLRQLGVQTVPAEDRRGILTFAEQAKFV